MIEIIMYFGIGFLCASLLGLIIIPLVHNRATGQEHSVKAAAVHDTGLALADKETALATLTAELGQRAALTDTQRVEIATLNTQVEALKTQLARYEKDVQDAEARLTRERSD